MALINYIVEPFTINNFKKNLVSHLRLPANKERIWGKRHIGHFTRYFKEIVGGTLVIEFPYIDKDFLEDHSQYSKCIKDYPRVCKRMHFFRNIFSQEQFNKLLSCEDVDIKTEELINNYFGYMIIRLLPETIIGRTCLKTSFANELIPYFGSNKDNFVLTAGANYEANLFGIHLPIEHSLPFQEQDNRAGACATSALWFIFQLTGHLFQHPIPSPSKITKMAKLSSTLEPFETPSVALSHTQIVSVINELGLKSFYKDIEPVYSAEKEKEGFYIGNEDKIPHEQFFKSIISAHLNANIPLLLGVELVNYSTKIAKQELHAVSITGYGRNSINKNNSPLYSDQIDKLYVHDDQVGCFSMMKIVYPDETFTYKRVLEEEYVSTKYYLTTCWGDDIIAIPSSLYIPFPMDIIIPFDTIIGKVYPFIYALNKLIEQNKELRVKNIKWDIFLSNLNELKTRLLTNCEIKSGHLRKLLKTHMSKYIWRVCARSYNDNKINLHEKLFEFIFDTTGIEQDNLLFSCIKYSTAFSRYIHDVISSEKIKSNELPESPSIIMSMI